MQNFDGAPDAIADVTDASILATNTNKSVFCVQGITQLGVPGVAYPISNWPQFCRTLGKYHSKSLFPLYCERALSAGARLVVLPVGHYSDPTDASTLTGTKATATLTVTGSGAGTSVWTAKAASEGYNGVTVSVTAPRSGSAGKVDVTEEKPGIEGTVTTIYDVAQAPSTAQKDTLNKKLKFVDLTSFTTRIPLGDVTLAGGVLDTDTIVDADYNGDAVAQTGWYAFDKVKGAQYLANFDRPTVAVDDGLAAYAIDRNDLRFFIRTPVGLTAEGMIDYRNRTGLFTGTAINSYMGVLIGGDITVRNPLDSDDTIDISAIADAAGARATADSKDGAWFAFAGSKRGKIGRTAGVPYNLGTAGLKDEANDVAKAGIIYVVDDDTYGPLLWGNASLQKDKSKLLAFDNVANLAMHMKRNLPGFAKSELFEPNDPTVWSQIYHNSLPFLTALENGRAIRPGEGVNWFWYGDQNVTDLDQLVYNTLEDIDAGIYRVKFLCKPINALQFIGIMATLTDSKTFDLQVIQQ